MRLTADTNVLVSAIGWEGPEAELISSALSGDAELVLGVEVLIEVA